MRNSKGTCRGHLDFTTSLKPFDTLKSLWFALKTTALHPSRDWTLGIGLGCCRNKTKRRSSAMVSPSCRWCCFPSRLSNTTNGHHCLNVLPIKLSMARSLRTLPLQLSTSCCRITILVLQISLWCRLQHQSVSHCPICSPPCQPYGFRRWYILSFGGSKLGSKKSNSGPAGNWSLWVGLGGFS
jgi:hypothetical protein